MIIRTKPRWMQWCKIALLTVACCVLAVVGFLKYSTSQARVAVIGHVVEIKPEVDGPVIAVKAQPNILVQKGSVLLQIDPTPYEARLKQIETDLAAAHQKIDRLRSELATAKATVETIQAQYDDIAHELGQVERLPDPGTGTEFRLMYILDERELVAMQLRTAKAQQLSASEAFVAQIGGANLAAAQLAVQLADARSHVDHATVRAPADGYVSKIDVAVGARAVTTRSAVSFIPADEITDRQRFLTGRTSTHTARRGHKNHTFASRIRALLH